MGKLSPSRQPKDSASPSIARKTSWSSENCEMKATSILRLFLTSRSISSMGVDLEPNPSFEGFWSLMSVLTRCRYFSHKKRNRMLFPSHLLLRISLIRTSCERRTMKFAHHRRAALSATGAIFPARQSRDHDRYPPDDGASLPVAVGGLSHRLLAGSRGAPSARHP